MLLWSGASAISSAVYVSVVLLSLAALVGNAIHLSDVTVHPIRGEIFQIQGVDVAEDDTERLRRGSSAVRRRRCSDCDNALEAAADEPVAYGAKSHRRQSGYEVGTTTGAASASASTTASPLLRSRVPLDTLPHGISTMIKKTLVAGISTAANDVDVIAAAIEAALNASASHADSNRAPRGSRQHKNKRRQPSLRSLLPAIPNSLDGSYSLGPGTRKHGGHKNGGGGAAPGPGRRPPTGYVGDVSADGGGVKYYYPERQALPLPKCFHNPTGYVCCNEKLNDLIVDTYTSLEQKPKFHQCNVQLIAVHLQNAAENSFGTPFETIVAYEDFAQKIHFRGDLVCKVELGGRYMLAYATAADGYTPNGSGHPRPRRNATVAGISEVGFMDSWTSIHTSFI